MQETDSKRPFWRQGDIYFVKLDEEIVEVQPPHVPAVEEIQQIDRHSRVR